MTSSYESLLSIIREVSQNTRYFKDYKETPNNIMVTCPFHKNGQESKPSCGIEINNLVYHCFTCGASGDFYDMLFQVYPQGDISVLKEASRPTLQIGRNHRESKQLKEIIHPKYNIGLTTYLEKRGVTQELCEDYEIGYSADEVIFPVRNLQGEKIFYVSRNVNQKMYQLSPTQKPLYGLYELFRDNNNLNPCFIVESVFNCLSLVSWGFKSIALLGTGSNEQMEQLAKLPIRKYIICMDGDEAGYKSAIRIKQHLPKKIVSILNMYEGMDVNDLTKEQFCELMKLQPRSRKKIERRQKD